MSTGHYLLCYDIADSRRLQKIYRTCSKYGAPYQYSVFHLQGDSALIDTVMSKLSKLIDPRADDVRLYPIGNSASITTLGRAFLPDDILFL